MIFLNLSTVLPKGSYVSRFRAEDIEITGIADHTKDICAGNLFICIKGAHFDPSGIMNYILNTGISAIVTEDKELSLPSDFPVFFVENIRAVQASIWSLYYGSPSRSMKLIAITGTNGKTTTARMLCSLLESGGHHSGYIGTLGTWDRGEVMHKTLFDTMTTPDPKLLYRDLRMLADRGVEYAVLEVSSHALASGRVAPLSFELGLFTNLSEEHLDFHHSMEEYFSVKASLFSKCSKGIFNLDDAYGERLYAMAKCTAIGCGILRPADFRATEPHESNEGGTNYTYQTPYGVSALYCPLPGSFNVYNSLLAAAAATLLGVRLDDLIYGMCTLSEIPGRMERLPLSEFGVSFDVIIDYAHTPFAMKEAIKAARKMTSGRLLVLFGAGGERDKGKRGAMGKIATELADFVYITSDNTRKESLVEIIKSILAGIGVTGKHRVITDRKAAIEAALADVRSGDTLLLLGKGHESYDWRHDGLHPFSERDIVRQYLARTR